MSEIKNVENVQIDALIKDGWRSRALDADRLIFVHPGYPSRMVEIASITSGDELPRDTDAILEGPPVVIGH